MKPVISQLLLISVLVCGAAAHGQMVTINGTTISAETGEAISGVSVEDSASKTATLSNRYGFFSLTVPAGARRLSVSAVTFAPVSIDLTLKKDTSMSLNLSSRTLSEIQISASSGPDMSPLGRISVQIEDLEAIPALFGERDIIKAMALLPGVALALEGSSGLVVRGGSPDQNLILLDGAKVFNPTHLFGLVSVFNSDAIERVTLYKGNFPAQYGGRIASVMDIQLKEGSSEDHEKSASIGLLSSRIRFSGPIGKEHKTHYLVTARSSYLGIFLAPISLAYRSGSSESAFNYWLYDLNGKVNRQFSNGSKLFLSAYTGQDFFSARDGKYALEESITRINWYNQTLSVRYTSPVGKKLFWSNQASFSRYQFRLGATEMFQENGKTQSNELDSRSGIANGMIQSALDLYPGKGHSIQVGIQGDYFGYRPINLTIKSSEQGVVQETTTFEQSLEPQAWIQDRWKKGRFALEGGIRVHGSLVSDTSFFVVEPRIQLQVHLHSSLHVHLGWGQTSQFSHIISATQLGLPGDVWVPVGQGLLPQRGEQWSLGLSGSSADRSWEASVEVYQRTNNNLSLYQPPFIEIGLLADEQFLQLMSVGGEGRSRGLEILLRTNQAKFFGWVSYTLAESIQRFDDFQNGSWQPSPFDIRHSLKAVGSYEVNDRWKLSGTWVLQSGRPFYLPSAMVPDPDGRSYVYYTGEPNRMPLYHRLDVGAEYSVSSSRSWSFGVYNLYNRANPTFLSVRRPFGGEEGYVSGVSLLPFLPYVSYTRDF